MKNNYGVRIIADNFNDLFVKAINAIDIYGEWGAPRGKRCKEIIATTLILNNPKECLCTIKDRKLNYAYLIIEKMMYLSGVQYPDILIAYNGGMKNYLNTGTGLFDGAYGPRIAQGNQFEYCYEQLMEDPDSRQALITINDFTDRRVSLDQPCTVYLQFLIRDGKLDLLVNMRSNDVMWGLCLDVPAFCFLQDVMSYWLGIPVGKYIHYDGSLHYYSEFEEQLLGYVNNDTETFIVENENETNMEYTINWQVNKELTKEALEVFWKEEKNVRELGRFNTTKFLTINLMLNRLRRYWESKNK